MTIDLSTLKNPRLLDFLQAVAAVQENPQVPLRALTGFDSLETNIAVATAMRLGLLKSAGGGHLALTETGLEWALAQLLPGRALYILKGRMAAETTNQEVAE